MPTPVRLLSPPFWAEKDRQPSLTATITPRSSNSAHSTAVERDPVSAVPDSGRSTVLLTTRPIGHPSGFWGVGVAIVPAGPSHPTFSSGRRPPGSSKQRRDRDRCRAPLAGERTLCSHKTRRNPADHRDAPP